MSLYQDDIMKIEAIARRIVKQEIDIAIKSLEKKINQAPPPAMPTETGADTATPKPKKEPRK